MQFNSTHSFPTWVLLLCILNSVVSTWSVVVVVVEGKCVSVSFQSIVMWRNRRHRTAVFSISFSTYLSMHFNCLQSDLNSFIFTLLSFTKITRLSNITRVHWNSINKVEKHYDIYYRADFLSQFPIRLARRRISEAVSRSQRGHGANRQRHECHWGGGGR